jgi:hypothetical protein
MIEKTPLTGARFSADAKGNWRRWHRERAILERMPEVRQIAVRGSCSTMS